MDLILSVIISGALIGAIYAAIGTGFSIALGTCKVVNFAHGQMVVAAAYVTYSMSSVVPLYLGGIVVIAMFAVIGFALHHYILDPLAKGNAATQIVITVVIASIFESVVALGYGTDGISARAWPADRSVDLGIQLNLGRVLGAAIAVVLLFALAEFLTRNRWGLAVRAAGDNVYGTELTGYNGRTVLSFGFGLATAMSAAAGVLLTPVLGFAPFDGLTYTLLAFVIVVVGGAGRLRGAIIVGIAYGSIESIGTYLFSADAAQVSLFVAMLVAIGIRGRMQGPVSARAVV